jgi:hypothetical protein
MRPKACVVDHSFHKVTHSFDFIRNILSHKYDLYDFWDDAWSGGEHIPVDKLNEFEAIFYFQAINPLKELSRIRGRIIWVPMYDSVTYRRAFWLKLSTLPVKVVCFSRKLFKLISSLGVSAVYVQYYLDPSNYTQTTDFKKRSVFYWFRGGINFDAMDKILTGNKIDSMDIRLAPDPNVQLSEPNEGIIKKYNIKTTKGLSSREEYISLISRNNIFIAPRLKEGIGISTLEALTMGKCVIAHNDSTMNEYIIDGHNGILIDATNPKPIDLSKFESIARHAYENCISGWKNWQNDIHRLQEFVYNPCIPNNSYSTYFRIRIIWVTIIDICRKHFAKIRRIFK